MQLLLIPLLWGALLLSELPALAGNPVTITREQPPGAALVGQPARANEDSPGFLREHLWEGSFDRAGDATRAVEQQLGSGLDFDCEAYSRGAPATRTQQARAPDWNAYSDCIERQRQAQDFARQAGSIRKEQRIFSNISKVTDAAALGSVGAAVYSELGIKNNSQAASMEKAANIQRIAGHASYATGATDFALGAVAYLHEKQKLEKMQQVLNGTRNGHTANAGAATNSNISNAIEQTKSAAYSHMLYGAGKIAVGYASIMAAKRSQSQADSLRSIEAEKMQAAMNPPRPPIPPAPAYVVLGSGTPPPYQSNQPDFILPGASNISATNTSPPPVASYPQGAGGGTSVALPAGSIRSMASTGNRGGGLSGGSGAGAFGASGSDASGASKLPEENAAKEKDAKETLGNSFEMSLTGGIRNSVGGHSSSDKEEGANLSALLGGMGVDPQKTGATGLNPNQVYHEALRGAEGVMGSMAGVNGGNGSSLFDIMRQKLTKMLQTGNVGASKAVEVRN